MRRQRTPDGPPRHFKRVKRPAFWDYTSTVTADSFGASRLPELEALLSPHRNRRVASLSDPLAAYTSGGRKTSDRHLRRRSNSHKPRRWFRQTGTTRETPDGTVNQDEQELPRLGAAEDSATAKAATDHVVTSDRVTDHPDTVTDQVDGDKSITAAAKETQDVVSPSGVEDGVSPRPCRRARRRKRHLLRMPHETWKASIASDALDDSGNSNTTAVHWMPTHIWHAKRFRMERLFGWMVPVLHSSRGCAAACRLAREKRCLIHDVTWSKQPVWFHLKDVSQQYSEVTEQMQRLIPDFMLTGQQGGFESGKGLLHCLDSFPRDAVAPISWIVCRECLQEQETEADAPKNDSLYVYFFSHPTCQQNLHESLKKVLQDVNCDGPYKGVTGGLQYYELRGGDAVFSSLQRCLLDCTVPSRQDLVDGQLVELQANPLLLLQYVCPRDIDGNSSMNAGVCGIDIVMGNPTSDELFLRLVREGGACAIGITEAAALHMVCEPPMPVFPRDYPDTLHGQLYWKGGFVQVGEQQDWACIRWHYEGGEGRIRDYDHRPHAAVAFESLVNDDQRSPAKVVVVRGQFLNPFEQAVQGMAASVSQQVNVGHQRPRRRKRRPGAKERSMITPRKGKEAEIEKHQSLCNALFSQLTLPALLVVHIQVECKGFFKPGAPLYDVKATERPLGFATSGVFCSVRGRYHGVGLVSASRLLQALASSSNDGAIVLQRSQENARSVCLRARIQGRVDLHNVVIGL